MEENIMPKTMAVIRFSSLGDVILTLPALRLLRAENNNSQIMMIVKEKYSAIFEHSPYVDRIIRFKEDPSRWSWASLAQCISIIRSAKIDELYDWHGSLRSRWLCLLSGVKRVHRYHKGSIGRRLLVITKRRIGEFPHTVQRYVGTISTTREEQPSPPYFFLTEQEKKWATDYILNIFSLKNKPIYPLIGVAPGAKHATKQWPIEHFASLVEQCSKVIPDARFLVFGDRYETDLGNYLAQRFHPILASCTGKTGLRQSAALLSLCSSLISNDSGLMHLSGALGVPCIVLFGPTVREFGFFPFVPHPLVIERDLPCRPCSVHGSGHCPLGTHECLRGISPQQVMEVLSTQLMSQENARG